MKKAGAKHPYCYQYPHPAVTVDCVVFALREEGLSLVLVQRKHDPFAGTWALPGGFLNIAEDLDHAARRELREETGLRGLALEQFHAFGQVGRDPRERVISVAFFGFARTPRLRLQAGSDAAQASWFVLRRLPKLAFDHAKIIRRAQRHFRRLIQSRPILLRCLAPPFTLSAARRIYEEAIGSPLNARLFNRGLLATGWLEFCSEDPAPPRRYRLKKGGELPF